MGGLNAGIGFSGGPCGALTGGACFLAYFSEGLDGRERDAMLREFHDYVIPLMFGNDGKEQPNG